MLIELDERRRASLRRLGHKEHRLYIADTEPDGTIVLRPAVVTTELAGRTESRPEVQAAIERSVGHPERWVRRGETTQPSDQS